MNNMLITPVNHAQIVEENVHIFAVILSGVVFFNVSNVDMKQAQPILMVVSDFGTVIQIVPVPVTRALSPMGGTFLDIYAD